MYKRKKGRESEVKIREERVNLNDLDTDSEKKSPGRPRNILLSTPFEILDEIIPELNKLCKEPNKELQRPTARELGLDKNAIKAAKAKGVKFGIRGDNARTKSV